MLRSVLIPLGVVCCLALIIIPSSLNAQQENNQTDSAIRSQRDLIGIAIRLLKIKQKNVDSVRLKKKIQFSLLPSAASVAGGGAAFVTALNASFYTGDASKTALSTVTFSPWFTLEGKFVVPFRSFIWFPNNALLWKGDTRFMVYPQYTWGLGGNTNVDEKILAEYNYGRLYHSLLKKIGHNILLGAGYDFDIHYNIQYEKDSTLEASLPGFEYYVSQGINTISSGPVLNFLVDSRNNSVNPSGGAYFAIDYRMNATFLGSTNNWNSILVDARKYFPFERKRQNLLAFWAYYWGNTNNMAPYLDLPTIGWDYYNRSGRGFQQNRYRSKQLINFESEYRRDISRDGLWGFVVFANLNAVSEFPGNNTFTYWHPAAGAGVRLKFNKISKTNIALDFGVSKDYAGLYIALGEAF